MAADNKTPMKHGAKLKTLKSYMIGLALSLIFTFIAFALVNVHSLHVSTLFILVTILAILQLIAQVVCFLRLNFEGEGKWNTMPFLFTILIVLVLVFGSLWIMYNLNYNMMN